MYSVFLIRILTFKDFSIDFSLCYQCLVLICQLVLNKYKCNEMDDTGRTFGRHALTF